MDILEDCQATIEEELKKLDGVLDVGNGTQSEAFQQTQTAIDAVVGKPNRNVDQILNQQSYLKMLIETDNKIKSIKERIMTCINETEEIRKECCEFDVNAIKDRQDLIETQAKELDRFIMQQLRSIAEDQRRHEALLEHRRHEIVQTKKEIENEEKNREAYLADVEKNLTRQLQERQEMTMGAGFSISSAGGPNDESVHCDNVELETINEYAPYGPTSTSSTQPKSKRGGSGRGRGRRGRGK